MDMNVSESTVLPKH